MVKVDLSVAPTARILAAWIPAAWIIVAWMLGSCQLSLNAAPCPCESGFFCCETQDRCLPDGDSSCFEPNAASNTDGISGSRATEEPVATPVGQPNLVRDFAFNADGNTVYWFDDGQWLILPGTPANHWNRKEIIRGGTFTTPSGLSAADIVGASIAANGEVLVWYDTGQLSRGTVTDLGGGRNETELERFVLPPGRQAAEILGIAADGTDNAAHETDNAAQETDNAAQETDNAAQETRYRAFFSDGTVAEGSATRFSNHGGSFAVQPETSPSRIVGLSALHRSVWAVYDDGAFSEGTAEQLDKKRFRPGAVAGMAMTEDATYLWYRSGLVTRLDGRPEPPATRVDELSRLDFSREQLFALTGVAAAPEQDGQHHFFAWFDDGTGLEATERTFSGATEIADIQLPPDTQWDDLLAIAISRTGQVASWFVDGQLAVGTAIDLAANPPIEFEPPEGFARESIAAIAIAKDTNRVHTLLADGSLADGSAVVLGVNQISLACDQNVDVCAPATCGDTDRSECSLDCHPLLPRCYELEPSNNLGPILNAVQDTMGLDLVLATDASLDTDTGTLTREDGTVVEVPFALLDAPVDGVPMIVLSVQSADVTNLRVRGSRGIALVAASDIVIRGELSVAAEGSVSGPGAFPSDASCTGAAGGLAFDLLGPTHGGGGGGGSHGESGHRGGSVDQRASGGRAGRLPPGRASFLQPLRGGCSGGDVRGFVSQGGGGGGALQLVSGTAIRLEPGSAINAGGGGGVNGGGGGSGGGILIEAPEVELGSGVAIMAGGGGGGCRSARGSDGLLAEERAPGGDCGEDAAAGSGGAGGIGSVSGRQAVRGESVAVTRGSSRGGGGGGGVGRIVIHNRDGELNLRDPIFTSGAVRPLRRR